MQSSESPLAGRPGPYGSIPPRARLTFVWAAILLSVVFVLGSQLAGLPAVGFMAALGAQDGAAASGVAFALLIGLVVPIFVTVIAVSVFWTRVFERRPLSTIGLAGGFWRFGRGLGAGLALGAGLLWLGAVFAPDDIAPMLTGFTLLNNPAGYVFLAVLLAMFAIQGSAEEVLYRGWLLSTISARRGPMLGVLLSSAAFAVVHAHYLIFAPATGVLVVLSVGLIGAVFAFLALAERSIWGVCGAHGAYNFIITASAIALALGNEPEESPYNVALRAFLEVTSVTEFDPSMPVSVALLAGLAWGTWAIWRRTERKRAAAAV